MSDITLSSGIRQNLLSLQNTSNDLTTTQEQLSTGKKVNSAFDNPTSYFTSQSLTNRSNDLSALLDQIGQAQQTLNAANDGLTGLTSLLEQALSTAQQAQQATTGTVTYSGTQTGSAIAADTTQAVSTTTFANAVDRLTASVQTTSVFNAAGLAQLTDGDTLTYSLAGTTVTATFGAATDTATNTFARSGRPDLRSNTGTGASGNLSAVAQVTNVGGAGGTVQVLGDDLTHNLTTSATSTGNALTAANFTGNTTTATPGRCADDFRRRRPLVDLLLRRPQRRYCKRHLHQFGQSHQRDRRLQPERHDHADRSTAAAANSCSAARTVRSRSVALSAPPIWAFRHSVQEQLQLDIGGTCRRQHADGPGRHGRGEYPDVRQRQRPRSRPWPGSKLRLPAIGDITATVNAQNKIVLTPTSTSLVTIGGTAGTVTGLGFSSGTTTPTATVVTASSTRATLQSNYNALLTQIDQLAGDSSYNGVNLLNSNNLTVNFNENGTSGLTIAGVNFSSAGLGLSALSGNGFQDNTNIDGTETAINNAITTVRAQTETFGTNSSTISTRQTFETNLINTLQTGASNLVLADQNQASANLLTEQTQQQLEISALSIANEANQSVLKLFG